MSPGTRAAWAVGAVAFAAFVAAPQRVQSDSVWMVPLALELVQHGELTLDRYAETCARAPHGCSMLAGHLRSEFPVAPAVVAAVPLGLFEGGVHLLGPVLRASPGLARQLDRWESHAHARGDVDLSFFDVTENLLASLCCALAVVFFVLALQRRVSVGDAVLLGLVFALGTPVFSTSSRVLWQSAPALAFAALALWLFVTGRPRALVGVALALAWTCRPTLSVLLVAFVLASALSGRRAVLHLLAGAVPVVAAFVLANQLSLGMPLPPYFRAARLDAWGPQVLEAAAGQLISPGRGLLVFTPVLLLLPLSVARLLTRAPAGPPPWRVHALELALAGALLAHWGALSLFPHWWGGHSFGPRLWAETMVGACWLLWPLLRAPARRLLLALALVGVLIHSRGATSGATWRWNDTPVNVDEAPQRVWDWGDLQFLR